MIERKCGIEVGAIPGDALMQGARERGLRPVADAGRGIWSDVGRKDRAERSPDPKATGKVLAVLGGVAALAVPRCGQNLPTADQLGGEARGRWRLNRRICARCARAKNASVPRTTTARTQVRLRFTMMPSPVADSSCAIRPNSPFAMSH